VSVETGLLAGIYSTVSVETGLLAGIYSTVTVETGLLAGISRVQFQIRTRYLRLF